MHSFLVKTSGIPKRLWRWLLSLDVGGFARARPWLFTVFAVLLFYSFWLTNEGTPSSDGRRILPQIDSIENSGNLLPFWDFERVGGMPTLADPERFVWLSWIDATSPTSNLQLNLVFIATALFCALGAYFLAREIRLSPYFSAMVAVALTTSQAMLNPIDFGRIDGVVYFGLTLFGMGCLIRSIRAGFAPLPFIIASICGAVQLTGGQYALVHPFLPMLAVAWATYRELGGSVLRAFAFAVLMTGAVGITALCLGAPWILPLLLAHLETGLSATIGLEWSYPELAALPGLLLPLTLDPIVNESQAMPLVAPLVCVGMLLVAVRRRIKLSSPYWTGFIVLALVASAWFLVAQSDTLRNIADHIPILGGIRHSLVYSRLFAISATFSAGLLANSIVANLEPERASGRRATLIVFGVVATFYVINVGLLIEYSTALTLLSVPVAFLVTGLAWYGAAGRFDRRRSEALFGLLVAVGVAANVPAAATRLLQSNPMSPPELAKDLAADTSYHRILCYRWLDLRDCKVPDGRLENIGGFSVYFLPAHQRFIEMLIGREVTEQRPHWVGSYSCEQIDPLLLSLGNVKYVLCRNGDRLTEPTNVVTKFRRSQLLERVNWKNALRLYGASQREQSESQNFKAMRAEIAGALAKNRVILNADGLGERGGPVSGLVKMKQLTANELRIEVESDKAGILVVPEYLAPGWSAKVNGEAVPLLRAFYMYRAVKVPAGKSQVVLAYWPPGLTAGLIIFVAAALLLAGVTIFFCLPSSRRGAQNGRDSSNAATSSVSMRAKASK